MNVALKLPNLLDKKKHGNAYIFRHSPVLKPEMDTLDIRWSWNLASCGRDR